MCTTPAAVAALTAAGADTGTLTVRVPGGDVQRGQLVDAQLGVQAGQVGVAHVYRQAGEPPAWR
ncbi:hypothetical protein JHV675_54630 [Mycobacterium avium subsp. hominissuis]